MLFRSVWLMLVNAGIEMPPDVEPFWTYVRTLAWLGFAWSRFGPTLPFVPAAASVWHEPQPFAAKTPLPATGSPWSVSVPPGFVTGGGVVDGGVVVTGGVTGALTPTPNLPFMPPAA